MFSNKIFFSVNFVNQSIIDKETKRGFPLTCTDSKGGNYKVI